MAEKGFKGLEVSEFGGLGSGVLGGFWGFGFLGSFSFGVRDWALGRLGFQVWVLETHLGRKSEAWGP